MIDAKRLAEQMTPKGMLMLAEMFDGFQEKWADSDAAVLREVARRGEKPATCGVSGCGKEAQTAPLCGTHIKDFMPNLGVRADGAPIFSQDASRFELAGRAYCAACGEIDCAGVGCRFAKGSVSAKPADAAPVFDADAIRDGIAQAFAGMTDQVYSAISDNVFSYLQKNGIQCPKR